MLALCWHSTPAVMLFIMLAYLTEAYLHSNVIVVDRPQFHQHSLKYTVLIGNVSLHPSEQKVYTVGCKKKFTFRNCNYAVVA